MEPLEEPVMVVRVEEAELDEMWSFVRSKAQQRWLWHAIDHRSGQILAYWIVSRDRLKSEIARALIFSSSIQMDGEPTSDC